MREFFFFAAVYGAAASMALLKAGVPFRWVMQTLDRVIFRNKTEDGGVLTMMSKCPACLAFWIALGDAFYYKPLGPTVGDHLMAAFAAVGLVWIVHVTLSKLGQYDL
jgi:hypothetical protein